MSLQFEIRSEGDLQKIQTLKSPLHIKLFCQEPGVFKKLLQILPALSKLDVQNEIIGLNDINFYSTVHSNNLCLRLKTGH